MLKQSSTNDVAQRLHKFIDFVTHEEVRKLFGNLLSLFKHDIVPLPTEAEVTYEQAIKYFVENNPDTNTVAKGVLKMEHEADKFKLTWLFLDQNDRPIYQSDGKACLRQTYALKIDKELEECFGGQNIIVFE